MGAVNILGGGTAMCAAAPQTFACAGNQMQSCIIDLTPQWIPADSPWGQPTYQYQAPAQHTHYHYAAAPAPLSDADVDRIARRVAELLKEQK